MERSKLFCTTSIHSLKIIEIEKFKCESINSYALPIVLLLLSGMYLIFLSNLLLFFIFSRNQVTKQLPRVPPYITCNNAKF